MREIKSSVNGWLFVAFWLVLFSCLVFLFSRWHNLNVGGITKTVVNHSLRKIVIRMDRASYYRARGTINGVKVNFLIDTGANSVAIPESIAKKAGLRAFLKTTVHTAGGKTHGQMTRIKTLTIGPIVLNNIKAMIMPESSKYVLLGMSALRKLEFRQRDDYFVLIQDVKF